MHKHPSSTVVPAARIRSIKAPTVQLTQQFRESEGNFYESEPTQRDAQDERTGTPSSVDLRSVVLLAGSVGRSGLTASIKRSFLDLPLTSECTVMDRWRNEIREFCRVQPSIPFRLLVDQHSASPSDSSTANVPQLQIERDPLPYRGTGGLLHDVARGYAFNGWILVVNAAQVLCMPLSDLADELLKAGGDVRLVTDEGSCVAGAMLMNCDALRSVAEVGYCDFKEQVLPSIRESGRSISVTTLRSQLGFSLRDRRTYLDAVALAHGKLSVQPCATQDSEDEGLARRFSIVEPGASVHPTAILFDAVVLAGAQIGPQAALIRSVVCAEGRVGSRQVVRDSLLA